MINFIEKSRSNYFEVNDLEAFKELCKDNQLKIFYGTDGNRKGKVGFVISDRNDVRGTSIHSFKKELSSLLKAEEVCVVRTIAHQEGSIDDMHGRTIAINSDGKELVVDLDQLYTLVANKWGLDVSPADE